MKAKELLAGRAWRFTGAPLPDAEIEDIVTSAETVSKNNVFVCTRTAVRDGHYSAWDAYSRGCRVFVARRSLGLPEAATVLVCEDTERALAELSATLYGPLPGEMKILGVTGTHGKSAVALLTAEILRQSGVKVGVLTGDGADDGNGFVAAGEIVPDAAEVWRFLHRCGGNDVKCAVLEFSAYMLKHGAAYGIPLTAALLTDLTPHHIGAGAHRDLAAYRLAKASLFHAHVACAYLPASEAGNMGCAAQTVVYDGGAPIWMADEGESLCDGRSGRRLRMRINGQEFSIFHPVLGDFACRNALAAATLATAAGALPADVATALGCVYPSGRLELIGHLEGRRVYLDCAYTAEELERVLRCLRAVTAGRLTVLLGSVGGRARERRAPLGAVAGRLADLTYFTADDPAGEATEAILTDLVEDWPRLARYDFVPDRAEAIQAAVGALLPGDVLLILGKAQAKTQLTAEGLCFFDDRAIALAALER